MVMNLPFEKILLDDAPLEIIDCKEDESPINFDEILDEGYCLVLNWSNLTENGFNFERTYGEVGKDYIQVHHIIPVSQMEGGYQVNPIIDLIPVCPNCHAMLHRKDPPIDPDVLKQMIAKEKK